MSSDLRHAGFPSSAVVLTICLALALVGCSAHSNGHAGSSASGTVQVVAAENFWGSIASQLGGAHADVVSIITNPNTDPHDYEPTAGDGRTVAEAQFVIENGVGYDPWMAKLAAANAVPGQRVLDIGRRLGLKAGDNPHRWYFPSDVQTVIDSITAGYKQLDPKDATYFDAQRTRFERTGLATYHRLIAEIRAKYAGTPVGASESIFQGLARATDLKLLTPYGYLDAISEGTDPTARDKATVDAQIAAHQIKVFVFNSQNSTPDIQALVAAAKRNHIPVTTITETLSPAGVNFQTWQSTQLRQLAAALAAGIRR